VKGYIMVKTLISAEQIKSRLQEVAAAIAHDYQGKEVILVGVLKGCFITLADLSRALWDAGLKDAEIDFLGISSYGKNTESSKNPRITFDMTTDIRNRHVLIIEDIIDTGFSLDALHRLLKTRHPASLKTFVLLSKHVRREVDVSVEYIGFEVNAWVEGYGLDSAEKNRHRPEVAEIIPENLPQE
jgi:hypoxanthine phosphoribosyltransferase